MVGTRLCALATAAAAFKTPTAELKTTALRSTWLEELNKEAVKEGPAGAPVAANYDDSERDDVEGGSSGSG